MLATDIGIAFDVTLSNYFEFLILKCFPTDIGSQLLIRISVPQSK